MKFLILHLLTYVELQELFDMRSINNGFVIEVTTTTTIVTTKIEEVSELTESFLQPDVLKECDIKSTIAISDDKNKKIEKCYVLRYGIDKQDVENFLLDNGIQTSKNFDKNFNGASFCTSDLSIVEKLKDFNTDLEEDIIFSIASTQSPISKHLFLMKNYTNYVFNSYFYNNLIFRIFQIDRIFKYFFGSYKYYYTGKNTKIFLIDTSVNVLAPNITNMSGRKRSCNSHGDINVDLVINKIRGFARDADIEVLDGVDCQGNIKLSELLSLLEVVKKDNKPTLLLFGVSGSYSKILNDITDNLYSKGIFIITPAGNNHDNSCYYSPSSAKHSLTVGSVNSHTKISSFSNYGSCVRLYSLGQDIYESNLTRGTSHAAASVAGAIAMFLEKYSNASNYEIWNFLESNSHWNNSYMVFKLPYLSLEYKNSRIIIKEKSDYFFLYFFVLITILIFFLIILYLIKKRRQRIMKREYIVDTNLRTHRPLD